MPAVFSVLEQGKIDAIVVGAGIIGVTTALALQQHGLKVMLLDGAQSVGQGCSFGNAGVIASSAFPFSAHYRMADLPAMFLKPSSPAALDWASAPRLLPWAIQYAKATRPDIVRRDTGLLHELCRDALKSYEQLLGADLPPINRCGYLIVHHAPSELYVAARLNSIRASLGVDVRIVAGPDLVELEPAVSNVAVGATFFDGAVHVQDPAAFVTSLADVFTQRGGRIRCDRVEGLESGGKGKVNVRGARAHYSPAAVVLAAGAHTNQLLAGCGHRIPLAAERGYHLELDIEPEFIFRPIALQNLGVILAPSQLGARIVGISHFGSPGLRARPGLLSSGLQRLRRLFPMLRPRPGFEVWSGERPTTPDSLPIVERVPGHRSIFVSCGHGHLGLTLAAVTARVTANIVTGISSNYSSQLSSRRFA
ncbi:NAD(P)/FAD-dependent oxidoreductase [Bradyrhizobium sp. DASA03007]|uniref:NAD(P)/FAD-dependent oxidoreductase n=1 Tax=unclassified Bradyrhizobium TaxID=2631580 RepID=UPI003F720BF4